ncbi:MAG: DUF1911 domain-containing protein [Ruminococcus sp.]|nr:DUF1911 domain-containing protein [Ruminococcus sp.]
MRGILKNDAYFAEKLTKSDDEVVHYEELIEKVRAARGENDRGVQNGYGILASIYFNRINLIYTSGKRDGEIDKAYNDLLRYYVKTWEPDNSYFELIKVLSLAILLNINSESEDMASLIKFLKDSNYQDYLVDLLVNFIDKEYDNSYPNFKWSTTYETLKDVAESENKENAIALLKSYLESQWYNIHKECAWYDSHKSTKTTYYGYWSFESGAIVKVLGLDDSSLKNQLYYPYDLVHRDGE